MSHSQDADPHRGGDLSSMAPTGTTIPNDAGKWNAIPSVPRPGEGFDSKDDVIGVNTTQNTLGGATVTQGQGRDIPRSYRDIGATGEVETGTG